MATYTLVLKRRDARTKDGFRIVSECTYQDVESNWMEEKVQDLTASSAPREYYEFRKWVEKTNLMTGLVFLEDPASPSYLSPASESYWSF